MLEIRTEPIFKPGKPRLLFRDSYVGPVPADGVPWDIHPDGKRFLMMKPPGATDRPAETGEPEAATPQPKITIVLNWFEELKARAPVK